MHQLEFDLGLPELQRWLGRTQWSAPHPLLFPQHPGRALWADSLGVEGEAGWGSEGQPSGAGHQQCLSGQWALWGLSCPTLPQALLMGPSSLAPDVAVLGLATPAPM